MIVVGTRESTRNRLQKSMSNFIQTKSLTHVWASTVFTRLDEQRVQFGLLKDRHTQCEKSTLDHKLINLKSRLAIARDNRSPRWRKTKAQFSTDNRICNKKNYRKREKESSWKLNKHYMSKSKRTPFNIYDMYMGHFFIE